MVDSLAKFLKAVSRFFFSDFFKPVSSFTPYLNYPPYLSDTMQVTGSTAQEYDDPNTMMKDYVNCAAILEWESARAANGIYYAVGSATYNGFY